MFIRLRSLKIPQIKSFNDFKFKRSITSNRNIPILAHTLLSHPKRLYSNLSKDDDYTYYFDLTTAEIDCQHLRKGIKAYEEKKKELNEIPDFKFIFDQTFNKLLKSHSENELKFPSEVLWVLHAPGTVTGRTIKQLALERGLYPISLRSLITYDKNIKDLTNEGKLFQNSDLLFALFNTLIKFNKGCLVFGIPRNKIQAKFMKLLHDKMIELCNKYNNKNYELPRWKYIIIHCDENTSIKKQLERGKRIKYHNKIVKETGSGIIVGELKSDFDEELAKGRYYIYKNEVLEGIKTVKEDFQFHIVDGSVDSSDALIERIHKELQYQSSLELNSECLNIINDFPLSSNVIINARKNMIKRLEWYNSNHLSLFLKVIEFLKTEFESELIKHSENGRILIRSENSLLSAPLALDMIRDILNERGYEVLSLIKNKYKPYCIEIDNHGVPVFKEVEYKEYVFDIRCKRSDLRNI